MSLQTNTRKIINDPVHGFFSIPFDSIFELIEHRYFQRLRRIKQLGLSDLVYPAATHTRFHHSIGATHLMHSAIESLRIKGNEISVEEEESALIAILLHDLGHGPFSHTLEHQFVEHLSHEDLSVLFMQEINKEMNQKLLMAIEIFTNNYSKKFLHQLVSSQLDVDRLDYLKRDSFFTGVSEGVIGSDRIIKMLNIKNDELVVEAKGIYSIEKFLIARRLMYWQVYLHKTVISAEQMLIKIIERAKQLVKQGVDLECPKFLAFFLFSQDKISLETPDLLSSFSLLDDYEIFSAIKIWSQSGDKILSFLCKSLLNRELYKVEIFTSKDEMLEKVEQKKKLLTEYFEAEHSDLKYYLITDSVSNKAYSIKDDKINILSKDGTLVDIAESSDILNLAVLSKNVKKFFVCYPKISR